MPSWEMQPSTWMETRGTVIKTDSVPGVVRNLTDLRKAVPALQLLDHPDLDGPCCVHNVSLVESVTAYMRDHCQHTSCGSSL